MPQWPVWSNETLESNLSSDTKCYETSSQKDRKYRSTQYNSASSRGKPPLNYTNEQFLDVSNDKTSFLYIGV